MPDQKESERSKLGMQQRAEDGEGSSGSIASR